MGKGFRKMTKSDNQQLATNNHQLYLFNRDAQRIAYDTPQATGLLLATKFSKIVPQLLEIATGHCSEMR